MRRLPPSYTRTDTLFPYTNALPIWLSPAGEGVRMVRPRGTPVHEALAVAEKNAGWILKHLDKVPARIPFVDGAVIPLLGEDHVIAHDAAARCGVSRDGGVIRVAGQIGRAHV